MVELQLKDTAYTCVRYKLRKWLEFDQLQSQLHKAVEDKDVVGYAQTLTRLISTALNVPDSEIEDAPWYEMVQAYSTITQLNQTRPIPLLRSESDKEAQPWEYEGRTWFWWAHIFAKQYGWTIPVIEELDIDEALSLLQEIKLEDQLEREWQWGMSETAYSYNSTTKKTEFHKLSRPNWMTGKVEVNLPATKVKFRKSMLPVGRVIGEDGNERIVL